MVLMDKRTYFYISSISVTTVVLFSSAATALEPASITEGPIQVIPQLSTQFGYDDNIFSTETNEVSSTKLVLFPSVQLRAENGLDQYSVNYEVSNGVYQDSSADNYTDHELSGRAYFDFNIRNRLELLAGYLKTHEDRGSGLNQGSNATANDVPVEYHVNSMQATYEYGGKEAKGRIKLVFGIQDREYDNFRTQTEPRDRQSINTSATFYYRVMPKTSLLFEVRNQEIDYELPAATLDSSERKYLIGAEWDATAKTSGTIRLGYSEKDFDSSARADDDGLSWELAMRWAPKTYSVVDISTSKEAQETDGIGNYIDTTSFDIQWTHAWSDVWRSRIFYGVSDDEYVSSVRKDDQTLYGVGVDYDLKRWLSFGLDYVHSDRDSNSADLNYEKNTLYFTAQVSF